MGIKRYKNAIRSARANKSYLKFLETPVDDSLVLFETGKSEEAKGRIFALLCCEEFCGKTRILAAGKNEIQLLKREMEHAGIKGVRTLARGSLEYRKALSDAATVITAKVLPAYFTKKEGQKIIAICNDFEDISLSELGLVQKTLLAADIIETSTPEKERDILKTYMLNNLTSETETDLYYAGYLTRTENCSLIDEMIRRGIIGSGDVIAFEDEIKPNVEEFMNEHSDMEFLQLVPGGAVTFADYVWQNLYKNHGWFEKKAGRYYDREYRRLFSGLKLGSIHFINTGLYERLEEILRCNCRRVFHKVPMLFYRQLVDVFLAHPKRLENAESRFDHIEKYDTDFAENVWDDSICTGVYVHPDRINVSEDTEKFRVSMKLTISAEKGCAEPGSDFIIGSTIHSDTFSYPMKVSVASRKTDRSIETVKCNIDTAFSKSDISGWYTNNIPLISIRAGNRELKVPILAGKKAGDRTFAAGDGNALVIRGRYRHLRFIVRDEMITDRRAEKIKLAAAFICAAVSPWNKPILLYEKYCMNYEESAAVLFEELVDRGYKNVRFVLNRNANGRDLIRDSYRKYIADQFSFSHYYNMFAAKSIISSEALGHALEKGTSSSLFSNFVLDGSKNYVFLQHGVMYMVGLSSEQRNFFDKAGGKGKQRVVVSSKLEADHFTDNTSYTAEDMYICGLIKFDRSVLNENADKIMVMLTWRPWEFVAGTWNMKETAYYKMLKRIVEAVPEDLRDKLVIMPHPLLAKQAAFNTDDEVWKFYVSDVKYDDLLKDTRVLITDYSSISYDAFYRGSNVIFDWEEKDQCMREYGENGHLMLTEELAFGEVCHRSEELRAAIEQAYKKGQSEKHLANYSKLVEFHDGKNSERFIEMAKKDGIL